MFQQKPRQGSIPVNYGLLAGAVSLRGKELGYLILRKPVSRAFAVAMWRLWVKLGIDTSFSRGRRVKLPDRATSPEGQLAELHWMARLNAHHILRPTRVPPARAGGFWLAAGGSMTEVPPWPSLEATKVEAR